MHFQMDPKLFSIFSKFQTNIKLSFLSPFLSISKISLSLPFFLFVPLFYLQEPPALLRSSCHWYAAPMDALCSSPPAWTACRRQCAASSAPPKLPSTASLPACARRCAHAAWTCPLWQPESLLPATAGWTRRSCATRWGGVSHLVVFFVFVFMFAVVASVVYAPGLGLGHFVLNDKDGACCMPHAVCGMWQVLACSTFYDYVMGLRQAKH